ncbi:hypothetical protein ACO0LF_18365 [Undibacterium sp. Di27W]|uniref:hypothetical protein n=1 Tax=Undibacterium sp. Di27W TaxID=3413036 RepID=UPI003BF0E856
MNHAPALVFPCPPPSTAERNPVGAASAANKPSHKPDMTDSLPPTPFTAKVHPIEN